MKSPTPSLEITIGKSKNIPSLIKGNFARTPSYITNLLNSNPSTHFGKKKENNKRTNTLPVNPMNTI
jgi:hypothetical protein